MSKELTPLQIKAIKSLEKTARSTYTDFGFGKLANWADVQKVSGLVVSNEWRERVLNIPTLKEFFAKAKEELTNESVQHTKTSSSSDRQREGGIHESVENIPTQEISRGYSNEEDDYSIIPSLRDNPKVEYFKEQERAAASILRHFLGLNHYAHALMAEAGEGKTFIYGAVVKELWKRKWRVLTDSVSLYPVTIITRASIVEQTERVMRDCFGLSLGQHVDVTNIEQLRAKFGQNLVKEVMLVTGGESKVVYEWVDILAPGLIILDECQSVKNIDSSQSQIFQAFNELDGENHRILFSSATPFTRVCESKCFAVATRLEF